MAERETAIDGDAFVRAIRDAVQAPQGLNVKLQPDEELHLVVASTEVTLFIGPSAGAETLFPPPATAKTSEDQEVNKRVRLRGRVGSNPQYKPLPQRGLRVGFRFAAFTSGDKPAWHDVYATGRFAAAIQAKGIVKGEEIELTGERQQGVQRQRDGSERMVERIFAYGVKKLAQRPS